MSPVSLSPSFRSTLFPPLINTAGGVTIAIRSGVLIAIRSGGLTAASNSQVASINGPPVRLGEFFPFTALATLVPNHLVDPGPSQGRNNCMPRDPATGAAVDPAEDIRAESFFEFSHHASIYSTLVCAINWPLPGSVGRIRAALLELVLDCSRRSRELSGYS